MYCISISRCIHMHKWLHIHTTALISVCTNSRTPTWPRRFWPAHTEVWMIFRNSCPVRGLKMKMAPLMGLVVKLPSNVWRGRRSQQTWVKPCKLLHNENVVAPWLPCGWWPGTHWCRQQTRWSDWRRALRSSARTGTVRWAHWSTTGGPCGSSPSGRRGRGWPSWSSPWLTVSEASFLGSSYRRHWRQKGRWSSVEGVCGTNRFTHARTCMYTHIHTHTHTHTHTRYLSAHTHCNKDSIHIGTTADTYVHYMYT